MRRSHEIMFGVEIENTVPRDIFQVGGRHSGIQVPALPTGWKAEMDGSVHASRNGYMAVEIVSPKLVGVNGLEQILTVCAFLRSQRSAVNRSCGLHVHCHWPHRRLDVLQRLVWYTANIQEALYAVTGSWRRRSNNFCIPIKDHCRGQEWSKNASLRSQPYQFQTRNMCLNLTNLLYDGRPTVEFRAFTGTVNAKKIVGYVQMCLALIQKAEHSHRCVSWDAKPNPTPVGVGRAELDRFMRLMGWLSSKQGIHRYGWIEGGPYPLDMIIVEMKRLAEKYDLQALRS